VLENVAFGELYIEFLYLLLRISKTLFEVFLPHLHVCNVLIREWIVDWHLLNDVIKRRSLSYVDRLSSEHFATGALFRVRVFWVVELSVHLAQVEL
jgi:hypothetical protein